MKTRIDRYRVCVATCGTVDYSSDASVSRFNAASDEMRRIASEPGAAEELLPLLDEPESAKWLAFQILELCAPGPDVRERCLKTVRELAAGSDADAMGAQMWLREHTE
jgi:hypothetical protein